MDSLLTIETLSLLSVITLDKLSKSGFIVDLATMATNSGLQQNRVSITKLAAKRNGRI
jgi:hypothetical protein